MTFTEHLIQNSFSFATAKRHGYIADDFKEWCKAEGVELDQVDYTTMMNYIHMLKHIGNKTRTIQQKLTVLRHLYAYLELGVNPALLIKLQRDTQQTPHGLLNQEELKEMYEAYPTHGLINKRDKILLGLIIYQGVTSGELERIETTDVDLHQGKIYIPAMRKTNGRTLELKSFQLLLLQDYMLTVRIKILQQADKTSLKLLVSIGKSENQLHNVVPKVIKNLHRSYPKFKDFKQVRQSTITQWITEHGLRPAQYMAGHRYVSSTERYNDEGKESLKNALRSMHPLK